jgi:hypothetical protein
MEPESSNPDQEARLVQADQRAFSLVDRQQPDTGTEEDDRRGDENRGDDHPQHDVRGTAQDVLRAAAVVPQHPPARARDLHREDRNQEDADERVHRQPTADVEQGRALDREQR